LRNAVPLTEWGPARWSAPTGDARDAVAPALVARGVERVRLPRVGGELCVGERARDVEQVVRREQRARTGRRSPAASGRPNGLRPPPPAIECGARPIGAPALEAGVVNVPTRSGAFGPSPRLVPSRAL
jgi:hypothetical protein